MNHRSRVAILAALMLFLLLSVLAVRGAVRGLSAPFEGLERLAQSRHAAPVEMEPTLEETVRNFDWDAPTPGPVVRKADAESKPAASTIAGELLSVVDRGKSMQLVYSVNLTVGAGEELLTFVSLGEELTIDSLASSLKLSDSQKARIAGLMEWRRWALDMMTDAQKADAEGVKKFEESFNEAVGMELDQEQAQAYKKLKSSRAQLLEVRGAARVALELTAARTESKWATELERQYKKTVK